MACASEQLSQRDSGFYAGGYEMDEWLPVPQTEEQRQALIESIQGLPMPVDVALDQLDAQRQAIVQADSYEQILLRRRSAVLRNGGLGYVQRRLGSAGSQLRLDPLHRPAADAHRPGGL
jgi:AAA+ superfamily predicted ATPase